MFAAGGTETDLCEALCGCTRNASRGIIPLMLNSWVTSLSSVTRENTQLERLLFQTDLYNLLTTNKQDNRYN